MKGRISSVQRVQHMLEAINKVKKFTHGMSEGEFDADERTVYACIRSLEILGEAARHVSEEIKQQYPEVSWQDATWLRNFVAHQYFAVDNKVLWEVITKHLPAMKLQLEHVLRALSA